MTINEILYTIAYCTFILGASKSFRENGSIRSVIIMICGISLDFLVSMLPLAGVGFLKMELEGTNNVITFAIILGFFVWILFVSALIIRKKRKWSIYHRLITAVQIVWFLDFILFLWGIYKFPLT